MTIQDKVSEIAKPLAEGLGLELVEVEWTSEAGRKVLRITIDTPGGISHEHCKALSRQLDLALDKVDLPEHYHLEVSSPGAERPLKTDADFVRFAGRRVFAKSKTPIEGRREWNGLLVGAGAETITIQANSREIVLPREQITHFRLAID